MKPGFTVLVLIIIAMSTVGIAQDKPQAKMVIEFSEATCDDLIAYTDLLAVPLGQDPESRGLAIFYPSRHNPGSILGPETFLLWDEKFIKRFGSNLPMRVHGKPRDMAKIEFWVVPAGADEPEY